jgi:hypothetical protein
MKFLLGFLLLLQLQPLVAGADDELNINTIQLKHRLASELLPKVEAFLPDAATVKAYDDLLIIKSDAITYFEIQKLVQQLDKPIQRVIVTVLRTHASLSELHGNSVQIDLEVDDNATANTQVRRWSSQTNSDADNYFRAQGISNHPILIHLKNSKPIQEQIIFFNQSGVQAAATTQRYLDIQSGFQALVQPRPDKQVKVDIQPVFSQINRLNEISKGQIITTISGPINQWLELGQINNEKSIESSSLNRYTTQRNQQNLYLKVELIP